MGLRESTNEKRIYLNIVDGKFAKRVPEGTEKSIEREIEYEGKKRMISELHYSSLDAVIKNIEIKEAGKFGDQLLIHMDDVGDSFIVTLGLGSREAKGFMLCLPNIDIQKIATFEPYNYERKKDNKKMIGMGIKQGDENIKYFYDAEHGLPMTKGDEQMDKDEFKLLMQQQTIWLKKQTKKFIEEHFKLAETKVGGITPNTNIDDASSDLPF